MMIMNMKQIVIDNENWGFTDWIAKFNGWKSTFVFFEMAYHYRKNNHSMKSQTIVMCCKNTKFVENCVCDINWRHFNFIDFSSVEIWTLFAKPIIALLYVPVQWWFSLVKCAITCVCLVFSAYRSYCTRINQRKN